MRQINQFRNHIFGVPKPRKTKKANKKPVVEVPVAQPKKQVKEIPLPQDFSVDLIKNYKDDLTALKNMVGNLIYPCIEYALGKEKPVAKITGMLIESQTQAHLERLVTDKKYLNDMVRDAKQLLTKSTQAAQTTQPAQPTQPAQ